MTSHVDVALLPDRVLRRLRPPGGLEHHVNVLLSLALVAMIFLTGWGLRLAENLPHWCLFERLLGVQCPGCGITRSLAYIASSDIDASLRIQPCGALLVMVLVGQAFARGALLLGWIDRKSGAIVIRRAGDGFVVSLVAWWLYRLAVN
jgi:hypothetical protein